MPKKKLRGEFEILIPDYIESKLIDELFKDNSRRRKIYNALDSGGKLSNIYTQEGKLVLEGSDRTFFENMYKILCDYLQENNINCASVGIGEKPKWYSPSTESNIQIFDMGSELYPVTWDFDGQSIISPSKSRQSRIMKEKNPLKTIKRKITEDDAERFVKGVWKDYTGAAALSGKLLLEDWPSQYGYKIGRSETPVNKTAGPEKITTYLNREMKKTAEMLRKRVLGK